MGGLSRCRGGAGAAEVWLDGCCVLFSFSLEVDSFGFLT